MLTVTGTMVNVTEKMELAIARQSFKERYANDNADPSTIPPIDGDGRSHERVGYRMPAEDNNIIGTDSLFYRLDIQEMMLTMLSLSDDSDERETAQQQVDLERYHDLSSLSDEEDDIIVLKELMQYRLAKRRRSSISRGDADADDVHDVYDDDDDEPQEERDDDRILQFHDHNDDSDDEAGAATVDVDLAHSDTTTAVPVAAAAAARVVDVHW